MDFAKKLRHSRQNRGKGSVTVNEKYAQRLQFYKIPPTETISLLEFEESAVERLKGFCHVCHVSFLNFLS